MLIGSNSSMELYLSFLIDADYAPRVGPRQQLFPASVRLVSKSFPLRIDDLYPWPGSMLG